MPPAGLTQLGLTTQIAVFGRHLNGDTFVAGDASLRAYFVTVSARHHLGRGWALDVELPAGLIHFDPGPNQPAGTVNGLGDVTLGARYDFAALWGARGYRPSLTLRTSLGLPTGTQGTIGKELSEGGTFPPSILAVGLATFSLGARLDLTQFVQRRVAILASLGTMIPLARTSSGITFPPVFDYALGALWLPLPKLALVARLAGRSRGHAEEGDMGDVVNSGGHWLAADASIAYRVDKRWAVGFNVRLPFYAHVNATATGKQLSESVAITASLSLSFGAEDPKKKGAKAASSQPTPATKPASRPSGTKARTADRGDVRDAASGGKSFELSKILATGKITVVDFWATWCKPCHVIDGLLRRLARDNPKTLAIRRVEVPTFDTAVAKEHLGTVSGLPVVRIYDAQGKRVAELVATSAAVVEARLKALLKN